MGMALDTTGIGGKEDLEGFQVLKAGQYHVLVIDVDEEPRTKDDEIIDGIRFKFEVLAGTVEGQEKREFDELIFNPANSTSPKARDFNIKKLTKLALATGVIQESDLGKSVEVEWTSMVGRQLVLGTSIRESEFNGRTYQNPQIDGLKIHAVGDPEVAEVPKDQAALGLIADNPPADTTQAPSQGQPANNYSDL